MKNSEEGTRILWLYLILFLWDLDVEAQSLINRAPYFLSGGDMARFSLPEDTKVGAPVYRLRGLDPEGSNVHYSISGEQLTVDRKSGIVSLLRPLDRETIDLMEVIISITGLSDLLIELCYNFTFMMASFVTEERQVSV